MNSENSFDNKPLNPQQRFISIDSQKYISEVEDLLKYFNKIENTNNRELVSIIFGYFEFYIIFYYYQDYLFDVSIHLKTKDIQNIINRKENFINLEAPLNSSKFSKTLKNDSQIKKLIFLKTNDYDYITDDPIFHVSFSENTFIINLSAIILDYHLNYLKNLLELWPGIILRLKNFKYWDDERLDLYQRLLIYREDSPLWGRLPLSKVVMNIGIDEFDIEFFVKLNKLKDLYDSLSKIYDVELENITFEDLFIKLF